MSSGRRVPAGSSAPAAASISIASVTRVTRWLAPCASAGVVERAPLLGDPHRAAAEVGDELLGERALGRAGGDAEDAAGEPGQVDGGAGEGHRRVQRDGPGADRGGRLEDGEAVPAGGVHDVLALVDRAAGAEHR